MTPEERIEMKPDSVYLRPEDNTLWIVTDRGNGSFNPQVRQLGSSEIVVIVFDEPSVPEGWREVDVTSLGFLLGKVDEIGDVTKPDLTYLFKDTPAAEQIRNRRIRSATGDDGYTALAKEIAAAQERAEEEAG